MGHLLYEIRLSLGRLAYRRGRLPGLLLLPAAVVLWGVLLPPDTLEQPLEVGLCPPQRPSQAAQALCEVLCRDTGGSVRFVLSDPDTARDRVAGGVWDCAFVLEEDFDRRLERGRSPVRLIVSQGSLIAGLAREAVAAALIQVSTPRLAGEYLEDSGLMPDGWEAARQVEAILRNDSPMEVLRVDAGGWEPATLAQSTAAPLLRGLAGLLLLCHGLLTAAALRRFQQGDWYRRKVSVAGPPRLLAGFLSAQVLLPLCAGALALAAGTLLLPGLKGLGWELACLALFQLALIPLALLLSRLPGVETMTGVCLPYVVIACLLLCPVLFDAGRLVPQLYPLTRAIPLTWYLTAADGSPLLLAVGCAGLWGAALLGVAIHVISERKKKPCSVTDAAHP